MEPLKDRIKKVLQEEIVIVPYNPQWPLMFESEKKHLRSCLPQEFIGRIEHFGSTAIPFLSAKPIIDILVEVVSLKKAKRRVVPILISQGYEYFWRPTWGDHTPPYYAWFIKRNVKGSRTHHIHMVESNFEHWDRLLFRDYLIDHPRIAKEYEILKLLLSKSFAKDRVLYTQKKTDFIEKITTIAREYYR